MTEAINIRFNGEANFGNVKTEIASLRAQFALLQKDSITAANVGNGNVRGYEGVAQGLEGLRNNLKLSATAAGDFQIIQQKLIPQSVKFGEAIKQEQVGLKGLFAQRKLMNVVLKEQIALQKASALSWSTDSSGRVSSDLIIPKNLPASMKTMRQEMGLWNSALSSVSQNTLNWGKNTQWAGRQLMTGLSLPLGILSVASLKLAYDLDKELTAVVKVYGDVTTGFVESTKTIRANATATAEAMAATYGQPAEETLKLMGAFAAAGKTGNELQQTTVEASKIALAGELKWQEASAATIALQTVYHHNSQQIGDDFAYINAMENQTVLTSQDFISAIPRAAGVIQELGGSLKDLGPLLVAMKSAGINPAEGANTLKSLAFRTVAPTKRAQATFMDATGIDLMTLVKQTKGEFVPTIKKISEALSGVDSIKKIAVTKDLFGLFQGSKALTMMDQLISGSEQMKQAWKVNSNTDEQNRAILKQELAQISQSDYQKIKIAWESIQLTLSKIGGKILPIAAQVVSFVNNLITSFSKLSDSTKNWVYIAGGIIGIAGPIIMLVGLFGNLLGNIVRTGTGLANLVLKFKITDAEERASYLLSKQAASGWDMQTTAVSALTLSLQELVATKRAEMRDLYPQLSTGAAPMIGPRTLEQTAQESVLRTPVIPLTKVDYENFPAGYSITSKGLLKDAQGRFTSEEKILAVQNKELIATQELANNTALQKKYSAEILLIRKDLVEQEAYDINMQRESALLREQTVKRLGGGLMGFGVIGTMVAGTDTLIGKLSNVAVMIGMISMMMPNLLSGLAKGFIGYGKAVGSFISTGWTEKLVTKAKAGIGTLVSGLRAAGPAIAVLAAGVYLYWNAVNDAQEKAKKQAEDFAKTTETIASVIGFSYQEVSPQSSLPAKDQAGLADLNAADFAKKNPNAAKTLANMFNVKDGATTGAMWAEAVAQAAQAKLHGASVQQAQDSAFTILKLMGSKISSAEFSIRIKGLIDFNDTAAVNEAALQGIGQTLERQIRDSGSGLEGFNRTFFQGTQSLTQAAGVAAVAAADQFTSIYLGTQEKDKPALLGRQIAILNAPYDRFVAQMPDKMKAAGITSGAEFSKALTLQGGTFGGGKAGWLESLGFDKAGVDSILKTSDAMKRYTQELALNGHASDAAAAGAIRIEDIIKILNPQKFIDAATALSQYNRVVAFAAMIGQPMNDVQKLAAMNVQRLAEGYPPATSLAEGFTLAMEASATAADTAATAVANLSTQMAASGIVGVTSEQALSSWKSVITGTISDISTVANTGLDALATSRLNAVQKSGAGALAALDAQSTKLDAAQNKQTEKHTALWDARKKAVNDAIKVEQNQETLRQKIFDAEKTRIQRMAEMFNKNVDLNMAINSGNLDTAAKIQNDMYATQMGWGVGTASDASKSASDAKVAVLQQKLDGIDLAQKADDKALKASQENIKKKVESEKKAQTEINKNNEAAVSARSAANKAGFTADLAVLTAFVPATKAQMEKQIADIQALYKKYGDGTLVPQGQNWGNIIATSLKTNMDKTANATASSKAWVTAGADIINSLLQGGFNMSGDQFAAWLNGGPLPPKAFETPKPQQYVGQGHTAPVGKAMGGRLSGPGTGTSDSIPIWASHGEFVVNAKQTAKNLPLLHSINNAEGFATGGQIGGMGAVPLMGIYAAMRDKFSDVIYAAAMQRRGTGAGPSTAPADAGTLGLTGTNVFAPGAGVARWSTMVLRALAMLGQPSSLLNTTLRRMNQESGGNPNAINLWDSNALKGTPSKGLMQTIDPTFNHYRLPSLSSNVYDPLSNIVASMRYAISRYGNLSNAYNRQGGYATGGLVMPQLKTGGYTLNDGYARLHKAETVLTAPLSKQLNDGIAKFANGAGNSYTIKADFNGATFNSDVDVERAFQNLMDKAERRNGSNRKIGVK